LDRASFAECNPADRSCSEVVRTLASGYSSPRILGRASGRPIGLFSRKSGRRLPAIQACTSKLRLLYDCLQSGDTHGEKTSVLLWRRFFEGNLVERTMAAAAQAVAALLAGGAAIPALCCHSPPQIGVAAAAARCHARVTGGSRKGRVLLLDKGRLVRWTRGPAPRRHRLQRIHREGAGGGSWTVCFLWKSVRQGPHRVGAFPSW
jgi:hypothetical protein